MTDEQEDNKEVIRAAAPELRGLVIKSKISLASIGGKKRKKRRRKKKKVIGNRFQQIIAAMNKPKASNEEQAECVATKHAFKRAKERLSWNKSALKNTMLKAYREGKPHEKTGGRLKRYISEKYRKYKTANNIRLYGENIYFFKDNVLLTLYRVPNEFIALANKL